MALVTHPLNVLAKEDKPVEIVQLGIYYYYNHREVLQMSKFTIPTKIKVLYRPQGIIFIIRGEAEDNKNDP